MDNLISQQARRNFWFMSFHGACSVVYERTGRESKLRKWLIDSLLPSINPRSLDSFFSRCPADFVIEMFQAFALKKGSVSDDSLPKATTAANYYE